MSRYDQPQGQYECDGIASCRDKANETKYLAGCKDVTKCPIVKEKNRQSNYFARTSRTPRQRTFGPLAHQVHTHPYWDIEASKPCKKCPPVAVGICYNAQHDVKSKVTAVQHLRQGSCCDRGQHIQGVRKLQQSQMLQDGNRLGLPGNSLRVLVHYPGPRKFPRNGWEYPGITSIVPGNH